MALSSNAAHSEMDGAEMDGAAPRGRCHWGMRWISIWGRDPNEGCAKMGAVTYAGAATGPFGGALNEAAILLRGLLKWARSRLRSLPLRPSADLPMGP